MTIKPLAHPEDIATLPVNMRRHVVETLRKIEANPEYGKVLDPANGHQHFEADISGLHSAVVGNANQYEAEVRIVYDVTPNAIEVVAIGLRTGSEVYKLAAKRLAQLRPITNRRIRISVPRRTPNYRAS